MKYCTNCGAKLEDEAKFCTNCGAKIEAAEAQNENPIETPIEQPIAEEIVETPVEETETEETITAVPGAPEVPTLPTVESAVELVKNDFPVSAVVFAFIACLTIGLPGLIFGILSKKKVKKYMRNGGAQTSLVKTVKIFATIALVLSIITVVIIGLIYFVYGIILGIAVAGGNVFNSAYTIGV